MVHKLAVLGIVALLLAACGASPVTTGRSEAQPGDITASSASLTVFAAASLTEAFTEIGKSFDAANGSTTSFNFAGSQQLAQQIAQGAPADVFASANAAQMNRVIEAGHVISGTQQVFARNRLVVIYPQDNPAQIGKLEDLARPDQKLVFAAQEVPVGQYTRDFLARASELPQFTAAYSETVLSNVVSFEENVRVVLSKVALGEADAGIVYTSDIVGDAAERVGRLEIPDELNTVATYPIAAVSDSPHQELADRFVAYVLSAEGQAALTRYGFLAAEGRGP